MNSSLRKSADWILLVTYVGCNNVMNNHNSKYGLHSIDIKDVLLYFFLFHNVVCHCCFDLCKLY